MQLVCADDAPTSVDEAFQVASSGRKGCHLWGIDNVIVAKFDSSN